MVLMRGLKGLMGTFTAAVAAVMIAAGALAFTPASAQAATKGYDVTIKATNGGTAETGLAGWDPDGKLLNPEGGYAQVEDLAERTIHNVGGSGMSLHVKHHPGWGYTTRVTVTDGKPGTKPFVAAERKPGMTGLEMWNIEVGGDHVYKVGGSSFSVGMLNNEPGLGISITSVTGPLVFTFESDPVPPVEFKFYDGTKISPDYLGSKKVAVGDAVGDVPADIASKIKVPEGKELYWTNYATDNVQSAKEYDPSYIVKEGNRHAGYAWYAHLRDIAPKTYTVSYDLAGGTLNGSEAVADKSVAIDAKGLLPEGTPIRGGYTFKGWELNGKAVTDASTLKSLGADASAKSFTIKAVWEKNAVPPVKTVEYRFYDATGKERVLVGSRKIAVGEAAGDVPADVLAKIKVPAGKELYWTSAADASDKDAVAYDSSAKVQEAAEPVSWYAHLRDADEGKPEPQPQPEQPKPQPEPQKPAAQQPKATAKAPAKQAALPATGDYAVAGVVVVAVLGVAAIVGSLVLRHRKH